MARLTLLLALVAAVSAFNGVVAPVRAPLGSKLAASRVAASPLLMADEPSEKAIVVGAASVGGLLGVYFFHELSVGIFLAGFLAYGATLSNSLGAASKAAGSTASKAYTKALELNEQYDILPKTKGALDTVSTAAGNLNENYGITSKIDESLQISERLSLASSKVDELKTSVSDKLDDLKTKAAAKSE